MARQTFRTTDVLRLDVENTPTGLVNLVQNPNGNYDGYASSYGWVTPTAGTSLVGTITSGLWNLQYLQGATTGGLFYTEPMPCAAGRYIAAQFKWTSGGNPATMQWEWLNSAGAVISSTATTSVSSTAAMPTGTLNWYAPVQAPSGTTKARLRFNITGTLNASIGCHIWSVAVATAATSGALTQATVNLTLPTATYTNVLGPTHTINVKRDELNVSTLTAEILDATLDPSQSDLVRPGKRVRLMAYVSGTNWQPIFTGKVINAKTKYNLKQPGAKQARITLTAVDAASTLAQARRDDGVATVAALPYVLEGAGVPWSTNGSGNQVPSATVVTNNANATAIDQVAIVRDSVLGYAWVDRRGFIQVWDRANMPSAIAATLKENAYSDLQLDYDTDRCINTVTVKLRRVNVSNGATVEVVYGPYVDQSSIDLWGAHSAEFTVQGITDSDAAASAYAAQILAVNATPVVRLNTATLPIATTTDVATKALLDLCDLVTVQYGDPVDDTVESEI